MEITHEVIELELFIDNDASSYGRVKASYQSLDRHIQKGDYNQTGAIDLLAKVAKQAAKDYARQCCSSPDEWRDLFPPDVRRLVARLFVNEYEDCIATGDTWWREAS